MWCCMRQRTWLTACLRTVWIRYNSQHNGEHSTYSCHLQALVELNVAVALADISTVHGEEESKTEARRAAAFISKSPWFQRVRDVAGIMEALIDRSRPLPPEFLLSDDTFQKVSAAHLQGEQLDMRCSPGRGACSLFRAARVGRRNGGHRDRSSLQARGDGGQGAHSRSSAARSALRQTELHGGPPQHDAVYHQEW